MKGGETIQLMKQIRKFEPAKWYTAYYENVGIPFYIVHTGESAKIVAWGLNFYNAEITTLGNVEMLSFVNGRRKFIAFADRRLDVEFYIKTYGEIPQWLEKELNK